MDEPPLQTHRQVIQKQRRNRERCSSVRGTHQFEDEGLTMRCIYCNLDLKKNCRFKLFLRIRPPTFREIDMGFSDRTKCVDCDEAHRKFFLFRHDVQMRGLKRCLVTKVDCDRVFGWRVPNDGIIPSVLSESLQDKYGEVDWEFDILNKPHTLLVCLLGYKRSRLKATLLGVSAEVLEEKEAMEEAAAKKEASAPISHRSRKSQPRTRTMTPRQSIRTSGPMTPRNRRRRMVRASSRASMSSSVPPDSARSLNSHTSLDEFRSPSPRLVPLIPAAEVGPYWALEDGFPGIVQDFAKRIVQLCEVRPASAKKESKIVICVGALSMSTHLATDLLRHSPVELSKGPSGARESFSRTEKVRNDSDGAIGGKNSTSHIFRTIYSELASVEALDFQETLMPMVWHRLRWGTTAAQGEGKNKTIKHRNLVFQFVLKRFDSGSRRMIHKSNFVFVSSKPRDGSVVKLRTKRKKKVDFSARISSSDSFRTGRRLKKANSGDSGSASRRHDLPYDIFQRGTILSWFIKSRILLRAENARIALLASVSPVEDDIEFTKEFSLFLPQVRKRVQKLIRLWD